jgi:nitrite reductase (NADH) small subunit
MIDVGCTEDFNEGSITLVQAGQHEVGIIRWQGRYYALRNSCPHQAGPVCAGTLRPLLAADAGESPTMKADSAIPVLACAWHGWEFDVRTGGALWDPGYRVRAYPIVVRGNRLCLDLRGRVKAPD